MRFVTCSIMRTTIGCARLVALLITTGAAAGCMVATVDPPPRRYAPPPPPGYRPPPPGYAQAPPPAGYPAPPPAPSAPPSPGPCIDPGPQDIPDLFDRPAPISAGSTIVGCIARGDADLFLVSVPPGAAGQLVVFSLRGANEMAPVIRVFDANRKQIDQVNRGAHQELRGWAYVAGGSQFFLRVGQIHGANEAYTLTTSATPLAEAGEPNNDAERAMPLVPGRAVSAFLAGPLNDPGAIDDWYRIDARRDGDMAIDIDMSQGIVPMVKLFDVNRREVTRQSAGAGERFRFQAKVRRGVYHLKLGSIHRVPAAGENDPPQALTRPYVITLAP
jgi:hypothetical protein